MSSIIDEYELDFEQAILHLRDELATLRVGRANPAIVEDVTVETYGSKAPLKQLASITAPSVRSLLIQPWDKTIIKDIEKAIIVADLGMSPVNEGVHIRLNVPQLTEESRKELARSIGDRAEKARISLRHVRDKAKDAVLAKEKNKEIAEDDRFDLIKKLDEQVKKYNAEVKELADKKEAELMQI